MSTNYKKHTSKNPIKKFFVQKFFNVLIKNAKKTSAVSILDVGCGEGFTLAELEKAEVGSQREGVDMSSQALEIAKKLYPTIKTTQGDIYQLSYPDNSFDLVICTEVLEHLIDPEKAIAEIIRVSKKYVLLSVPNEPFFTIARLGNHPEHINHWSTKSFAKFVQNANLKIMSKEKSFPWTIILAQK